MNTLIGIIIPLALAVGLAFPVWGLICNERTHRHRGDIFRAVAASGDRFWRLMWQYEAVSYDAHLWCLIRFQNPRNLYHDDLNNCVDAYLQEAA